jgi:hypothetical protein
MCISANTSISTFFISIIGSLTLIYYGNKNYNIENIIIGLFFIYIAFVQLFEFFIWIDIDNKIGINKIFTLILPIYIYIQPLILYNLQLFFYKISNNIISVLVELFYLIYYLFQYFNFVKGGNNYVIKCNNNYLDWGWLYYFNNIPYFILFIYAIFIFMPLQIALLVFIVGFTFNSISLLYFKNTGNYGSFFCFFSAFSPIIFLFIQYLL